jgi:hypothetical protein
MTETDRGRLDEIMKDDNVDIRHSLSRNFSSIDESYIYLAYDIRPGNKEGIILSTITFFKENEETHKVSDLLQFVFQFNVDGDFIKHGYHCENPITVMTTFPRNRFKELRKFVNDKLNKKWIEKLTKYISDSGLEFYIESVEADTILLQLYGAPSSWSAQYSEKLMKLCSEDKL